MYINNIPSLQLREAYGGRLRTSELPGAGACSGGEEEPQEILLQEPDEMPRLRHVSRPQDYPSQQEHARLLRLPGRTRPEDYYVLIVWEGGSSLYNSQWPFPLPNFVSLILVCSLQFLTLIIIVLSAKVSLNLVPCNSL